MINPNNNEYYEDPDSLGLVEEVEPIYFSIDDQSVWADIEHELMPHQVGFICKWFESSKDLTISNSVRGRSHGSIHGFMIAIDASSSAKDELSAISSLISELEIEELVLAIQNV